MLRSSIKVTMTLIFYKSGDRRNYDVVNINTKEVYVIERYYRKSKSIKGLKRMIVKIKQNCSNLYIPYIGMIKLLDFPMGMLKVQMIVHTPECRRKHWKEKKLY